MDWTDEAIVLSARRHGESGWIVMLLTQARGRHAGLARGKQVRGAIEPGSRVQARWRARLAEHLGSLELEPIETPSAVLLDDPDRLAALVSACALVEAALPERAAYPHVFAGLSALIAALPGPFWDAVYVRWELELLSALGFGLDLRRCAASGRNDQLAYVSPRTGRAVSLSAAEPYRDRLLPLPGFLVGAGEADAGAVRQGLALAGHFLERWLFAQAHHPVPAARTRFAERYARRDGNVADGDVEAGQVS